MRNGRGQDTRSINSGSGEFGGLFTRDALAARLDIVGLLASASNISEVEKVMHFFSLSGTSGNAVCGVGIESIEHASTDQQMSKAAVM